VPAAGVAGLSAGVNEGLKSPELQESLAGMSSKRTSPSDFATFFAAEAQRWPLIVRAADNRAGVAPHD